MSQKCNSTDRIISLDKRDFNINNLNEKYKEKCNKIKKIKYLYILYN